MKSRFLFLISVLFASHASAATLTEDFTTLDHADPANSTGVWNIVDHSARARAYANGATESTRPIDFGNGSDGVVNTNAGYTFNTDTHPNGYNFQSLSITGGTITVVGSHPLIIRSLSTITITPPIQVNGGNGANGSTSGAAIAGGSAVTCLARGGNGGANASDGTDAIANDGAVQVGTKGLGKGTAGWNVSEEPTLATSTGPQNTDFDTSPSTDFICGTSGAGGGGYSDGTFSASGGSGGAGGGRLHLVAVGNIQVGAVEAKGGDGGNGVDLDPGKCSGSGNGGYGGVIFFQSLNSVTASVDPDVSAGLPGNSLCSSNTQGVWGYIRADVNSAAGAPPWTLYPPVSYNSDEVPANLQSYVQSKAYDLGVLNASFTGEDVQPSSSNVTMSYSGSADGVNFSGFSDLASVSDRGYRFIKFRATFTNPASGNVAPKITGLTLQYEDLGLAKLDAKLLAGCGTLAVAGRKPPSSPGSDAAGALFTLMAVLVCYGISRVKVGKT